MWKSAATSLVLVLGALVVSPLPAIALAAPSPHTQEAESPIRQALSADALRGPAPRSASTRDFPNLPQRCFDPAIVGAPKPSACRITSFRADRPTVVLWGDSHAQQYLPPVRKAIRDRNVNLVAFISGGCPPVWVPRQSTGYPNCEAKNRAALNWIEKHRNAGEKVTVILSSSWSRWRYFYRVVMADERAGRPQQFDDAIVRLIKLSHHGIPRVFRALGKLGIRVDVVGISGVYPPEGKPACPEGEDPYRCALPRADVIQDEASTERFLDKQMGKLDGPHRFIDTSHTYCGPYRCFGTVGGRPTFYDEAHLSKSLTRTMTKYFVRTAKRAAGRT